MNTVTSQTEVRPDALKLVMRSRFVWLSALALALAACPSPRTPPPTSAPQAARAPTAPATAPATAATQATPAAPLAFIDPGQSSRTATVTARLRSVRAVTPHCGGFHFGTVMEYELVSVEAGTLAPGTGLLVGVGCPDIPRDRYDTNAGSLDAFRIGGLHRLTLSTDRSDNRGMAVDETEPLFYAISADAV